MGPDKSTATKEHRFSDHTSTNASTPGCQEDKSPDSMSRLAKKRLNKSNRVRYDALIQIGVPPSDAALLAKHSFGELKKMGYKFANTSQQNLEEQYHETAPIEVNPAEGRPKLRAKRPPHKERDTASLDDKTYNNSLPLSNQEEVEGPVWNTSVKIRFRSLLKNGVPPAEAEKLAESNYTISELEQMGYKLHKPPQKATEKRCHSEPVPPKRRNLPTSAPMKEDFSTSIQRSNYDLRYKALLTIGVPHSEAEKLAEKPFGELKKMGFKFPNMSQNNSAPYVQREEVIKKHVVETTHKKTNPHLENNKYSSNKTSTHSNPSKTQVEVPQMKADVAHPIRVGIMHTQPMTDIEMKLLRDNILSTIAGMPMGEGPVFEDCLLKPGWLLITCENERSKKWLDEKIPTLKPWLGADLVVVEEEDFPRSYTATLFIPDTGVTGIEVALDLIRAQNVGLNTDQWRILNSDVEEGGILVNLSLDDKSVEVLKRSNLRANLGFKKVQFQLQEVPHSDKHTVANTELHSVNVPDAGMEPADIASGSTYYGYPSNFENEWEYARGTSNVQEWEQTRRNDNTQDWEDRGDRSLGAHRY